MRNTSRPAVGSLEWENLGGPPLSAAQRLALLAGTAQCCSVTLVGDCVGHSADAA